MKSPDSSLHSVDYYLERAEACERSAAEALSEENRGVLRQLATRWRALAAEAQKSSSDRR
jgi:hypothetical protein